MNWVVILVRPLAALAFFGSAAVISRGITRLGVRRGWNGRFWLYISRSMPLSDPKGSWAPVLWLLGAWVALMALIYFAPNSPIGP